MNLTPALELIHMLGKKFTVVYPSLIPRQEHGEILIDSRREGSLQKQSIQIRKLWVSQFFEMSFARPCGNATSIEARAVWRDYLSKPK